MGLCFFDILSSDWGGHASVFRDRTSGFGMYGCSLKYGLLPCSPLCGPGPFQGVWGSSLPSAFGCELWDTPLDPSSSEQRAAAI